MLIAVRLRFPRPAALARRRSFVFALLAAAVGLAIAAPGARATGGAQLEIAASRRAAARAVKTLRAESPAATRMLDRLIADAETITAQEATAPGWRRNPGRVEAAWARVLASARTALVELRRRERPYGERWATLAGDVELEVARAADESVEAGVGRREIAAAKQAGLKWELAQRYATAGEHERAVAEAEQARSFAATVHRSFGELHSRFSDSRNLTLWRRMVKETVDASRQRQATAFVVDKLNRRLLVYESGKRVATYRAELGAKGLKQKMHSGDQATPEGRYRVTQVRGPGRTRYYKALLIDYPNAEDRARHAWGKRTGQVPTRAGIGSLIEIHGEGGKGVDWTDGCVALSNRDMDKVFARAHVGTPVTIVGTF